MVVDAGPQLGARAFFTPFRVPDDAGNGSNGQAMPDLQLMQKMPMVSGRVNSLKLSERG